MELTTDKEIFTCIYLCARSIRAKTDNALHLVNTNRSVKPFFQTVYRADVVELWDRVNFQGRAVMETTKLHTAHNQFIQQQYGIDHTR